MTGLELSHSGMYAGTYMTDKSKQKGLVQYSSSDGVRPDGIPVKGLDKEMMKEIIDAYARTAALGKRAGFEGGQTPLARRLPKLPGFTNINRVEYVPVNVKLLEERFESGDVVDHESLVAKNIIKHYEDLVKILGDGDLTKALTVKVDKVSASAKAKIEACGGKVEEPC